MRHTKKIVLKYMLNNVVNIEIFFHILSSKYIDAKNVNNYNMENVKSIA